MPRKPKTAAEVLARFAPRQPPPEPPDQAPVRVEVQAEAAPILEPLKPSGEGAAQVEHKRPGKRKARAKASRPPKNKAKVLETARGKGPVLGPEIVEMVEKTAPEASIPRAPNPPTPERELPPLPAEPAEVECAAPLLTVPTAEDAAYLEKLSSLHLQVDMVSLAQEHYREFPDFLTDVWKHVIPGSPKPTAIQRDLADYLQNGPSRRMVLGFRGLAKSYIFGVYFMWRLLHDPEERMKYLSGDEDKVVQFSNWTKNLRELSHFPVLRHLRSKKDQKDDQYLWDVGPASLQQYNTFMGAPATAAISGGRCTIGGLDDCEQNSNSDSELKRAKLLRNALDVSNMLIPESRQDMIVLGTYKSLNSIYITLARERGYDVQFYPCLVPSRPKDYRGKLAPTIAKMAEDKDKAGQSVEPTRWTAADLKVHEKEKGPLQFQLEWMVSDQHGDRYEHPFPLDRLIVWEGVNPHGAPAKIQQGVGERDRIADLPCLGLSGDFFYKPGFVDSSIMLPYGNILMSIDPSGSGDKDEAAWVVLGAVPGQIHLLDWGGKTCGVDPKVMKEIATVAHRWNVREIIYENNMAAWGNLFEAAMKEASYRDSNGRVTVGHFCKVEGIRSTRNKEERITATLEPIIYGGQLILSRKALQDEYDRGLRSGDPRWQERLLQYQIAMFRRYTKAGGLEFDDRIDALTLGLLHLHERFLKTGTSAAAQAERERIEGEEFSRWQEGVFGSSEPEPLWVNTRR